MSLWRINSNKGSISVSKDAYGVVVISTIRSNAEIYALGPVDYEKLLVSNASPSMCIGMKPDAHLFLKCLLMVRQDQYFKNMNKKG